MSLIGMLKELNLLNLVQLHCCERQQAQVFMTHGGCEGRLMFTGGELVFASVGGLTGEEAVHEMLTWEDGNFRVEYDTAPVVRNVQTPWSVLLLEGMRRLDEARAERDARLEATLRSVKGTDGLRGALVTNNTGQILAAATAGPAAASAALVAFLGGRLQTIGGLLNCGACRDVCVSGPGETIWIARRDGNYLACWLDGWASLASVKRLVQPLLSWAPADAPQGAARESSRSR